MVIYTPTHGALIAQIVEALGDFFAHSPILWQTAAAIGIIGIAIRWVGAPDLLPPAIRWIAKSILWTQLLGYAPVSTTVIELQTGYPYPVSRVPLALAWAAQGITGAWHLLTRVIQILLPTPFADPQDRVFPATVLTPSPLLRFSDPALARDLRYFMTHCIGPDLQAGRYTLQEWLHHPAPWHFLTLRSHPQRTGSPPNQPRQTCVQAAYQIPIRWHRMLATHYSHPQAKRLQSALVFFYKNPDPIRPDLGSWIMRTQWIAAWRALASPETPFGTGASIHSPSLTSGHAVRAYLPWIHILFQALWYLACIPLGLVVLSPKGGTWLLRYGIIGLWIHSWDGIWQLNQAIVLYMLRTSEMAWEPSPGSAPLGSLAHHGFSLALYEQAAAWVGWMGMGIPLATGYLTCHAIRRFGPVHPNSTSAKRSRMPKLPP